MGLDLQAAFNLAMAGGGALVGFLIKAMWDAIKDMQDADKQLAAKVSSIEVLVAGNYIPRSEYGADMMHIRESLRRIEDKLDGKVDK